jgi:hypothetical protein
MASTITGIYSTYTSQEDQYIEGAPAIFIQDTRGPGLYYSPDADGYYWGLTGSAAYPVYEIGCYEGVQLADNLEINTIRCDRDGDSATIMKRNYIELNFTLKSLLPLEIVAPLLNWSDVLTTSGFEKTGIGIIDNNRFLRAALIKVYDPTNSDYVYFMIHRGQMVQNSTIDYTYGQPWQVDVTLRGYADTTKPDNQKFATVIRHDDTAL